MNYNELVEKCVSKKLNRIVLSKAVNKEEISQSRIRPVIIKEKLLYQITESVGNKETNTCREVHENLSEKELKEYLLKVVPQKFLQGLFETEEEGFTVMANRKGTVTVCKNKSVSVPKAPLEHNRKKQYLISEGEKVPFMVDLGVMTPEGAVVKSKYDKFRQINRYLEFVEDVADKLPSDREITIIDFGCGKSYLTFALYYYLNIRRKFNARIIGLDLKTDVINECSKLARKYHYDKLTFIEGDIEHFSDVDAVDMVITLHACDTATDYAIYKAVSWNAGVIMAVPCCQHELNRKFAVKELSGISEYGILKDRISAIFTDAMRANLLKECGYETQILEFIDMEHTPKNLLIKAVKSGKMVSKEELKREEMLENILGTDITLKRLLKCGD